MRKGKVREVLKRSPGKNNGLDNSIFSGQSPRLASRGSSYHWADDLGMVRDEEEKMKGTHHEAFNTITLTPFSFYLMSIGLPYMEVTLFWLHGMFHTFLVTPDNDIPSRSTKRLGFVGWIIDKMFKHHGLLHKPIFWTLLYMVIYLRYHVWWVSGGLTAIYLHIITDGISTRVKRIVPW